MTLPFQGLILPKIIYSTSSKYNNQIDIIDIGSTRKIQVDKIVQSLSWNSPNVPRLVWGKALDVIKENQPNLKNIMILGLGGATVQHLISRQFPDAYMISVEIDPVMVDVAKKYFDLDSIKNHRVITEDACRVIIEPENYDITPKTFQVVFVDIYIGSQFPELGKSGNFISAVKNLVIPGGLVVINRIYTKNHQDEVNHFIDFVENNLNYVQTLVVAGYTNSDNVLIFGRT